MALTQTLRVRGGIKKSYQNHAGLIVNEVRGQLLCIMHPLFSVSLESFINEVNTCGESQTQTETERQRHRFRETERDTHV